MRIRTGSRLLPAALCVLACLPAAASADLAPGEAFPQWVLPSLDGKERTVADFRGRKIALHVFASW